MDREHLERLLDGISNEDEDARRELLAYIDRQPSGIQALAYEALNEGGDDTYEQLILTLADDPKLYIRPSQKTDFAQKMGRLTAEEVEALAAVPLHPRKQEIPFVTVTTLRIGDRNERVQAARILADYGADAVGYLLETFKSGDRLLIGAAAESLQVIGDPAVSAVLPYTGDSDQQLQWYAYKVLSTTANPTAIPALLSGLELSNSGTRWLAAEGLVKVGQPALRPLFQRLTGEKLSTWLRSGVVHVLNKMNWKNDEERLYYSKLANEIKISPVATLSHIARRELERLN